MIESLCRPVSKMIGGQIMGMFTTGAVFLVACAILIDIGLLRVCAVFLLFFRRGYLDRNPRRRVLRAGVVDFVSRRNSYPSVRAVRTIKKIAVETVNDFILIPSSDV